MKTVCIVAPEFLPVPAVKGGAIETLIQSILDENEIQKKVNIICITIFDKTASTLYDKYKYTKFIPIKIFDKKRGIGKFLAMFNYAIKRTFKFDIRATSRTKKYEKAINSIQADGIIFEYPCNYITKECANKIGKDKIVLHLHNIYSFEDKWREIFGSYIVLSNYCKDKVLINSGISSEKVRVIYNGIEFNKFCKKAKSKDIDFIRNQFNIPNDKLIILYTGRLMQIKGVEELIIAFKRLKNKEKACLVLCGGNEFNRNNDTEYVKKLKQLSHGENIIFTGYVQNSELYKIYQMSDIAVFPSTGEEGLGNVVIEAMISKLPTIISNSGGMPELVNKDSSYVIDLNNNFVEGLANSIDILLDDKSLRKRMGDEGYKISQSFSSKKYYNEYIQYIFEKF